MAANPTMKIANKIFMPLLRSPLHFLVSHGMMLITVTGRKTGKQYTTAVAYVRDDQRVVFFSGRDLLWIKNLEGGAPVMLRLRGKDLPATACLCPADDPDFPRLFKKLYSYLPLEKAGTMVMVSVKFNNL
jgi:deazaflavin-dependent oxidoreductase (nitroreductase family)